MEEFITCSCKQSFDFGKKKTDNIMTGLFLTAWFTYISRRESRARVS